MNFIPDWKPQCSIATRVSMYNLLQHKSLNWHYANKYTVTRVFVTPVPKFTYTATTMGFVLFTPSPLCVHKQILRSNPHWPDIYESAAYSNRNYLSTHIHDIRIIKLKRNLVYTCVKTGKKKCLNKHKYDLFRETGHYTTTYTLLHYLLLFQYNLLSWSTTKSLLWLEPTDGTAGYLNPINLVT